MRYKKRGKLKLFGSKRGMDIDLWFNTFELLMVAIVALVLFELVNDEATGSTYEKIYLARDKALLVNTIYAAQGDLNYYYPENTKNFFFEFKPNEIEVYAQNEIAESAVKYPFAEDKNYEFSYGKLANTNQKIVYTKIKDNIQVVSATPFSDLKGNIGGTGATGYT